MDGCKTCVDVPHAPLAPAPTEFSTIDYRLFKKVSISIISVLTVRGAQNVCFNRWAPEIAKTGERLSGLVRLAKERSKLSGSNPVPAQTPQLSGSGCPPAGRALRAREQPGTRQFQG